jgi:TPR repeat protein
MSLRIVSLCAPLLTPILLTTCAHPDLTASLSCPPDPNAAPPISSSTYQANSIPELKDKAGAGDLAAARVFGERYEHGNGVGTDIDKAVQCYQRAAIVLPETRIVIAPAVGESPSYVIPISAGLSTPGDALALSRLAALYRQGRGVPFDCVQANKLSYCASTPGASPIDEVTERNLNASEFEG